jgi:GNAT superfamily N-acetyltransferase
MISIRRIRLGEGQLFKDLRLAALTESPNAFSSTYESAVERSWESWRDQADGSASGNDRCTLIAFAGGTPVGLGAVYRDGPQADEGELLQFWVRPDWRNHGVGRKLLEALLRWCEENGIVRVRASVTAGNDRAARFYTRYRFALLASANGDGSGCSVLVRTIEGHRAHTANQRVRPVRNGQASPDGRGRCRQVTG